MSSAFFGLGIANSGINAYQASINTTANNIANLETDGYSRQITNLEAASSLRVYSRYGCVSTGVDIVNVTAERDLYYDEKFWNNQSSLGLHEKKLYYLKQIENFFVDNKAQGQVGFSSIYADMFTALDSMKDNAGDETVRAAFIANAQNLCDYFNSMAIGLSELQNTINDEIKTSVDNINAIAEKVAVLNKQINIIEIEGGNANELRDERAVLIDELSAYVPITVSENDVVDSHNGSKTGATNYLVKINGATLVDTYEYRTLRCEAREYNANQSDIDGLYDIVWDVTGNRFDTTSGKMSGYIKALFEMRDGNNKQVVSGTVTNTTSMSLTISNPSITDVSKMNLSPGGELTVNATRYNYDGFTTELDKDGNIVSYTFNLTRAMTDVERSNNGGRELVVGAALDTMGIPYYQNQMNEFLRNFVAIFNDLESQGADLNGNPMGSFFIGKKEIGGEYEFGDVKNLKDESNSDVLDDSGNPIEVANISSITDSYYMLTAKNIAVNDASTRDPKIFATTTERQIKQGNIDAYDIAEKLMELESKVTIFRGGGADTFLQCMYSDISVDTQEADIFYNNYNNIKETIDNQRASVSSVDQDEEAMDLVKFQNAYNMNCKVISVLQEMYDQLILNTGV